MSNTIDLGVRLRGETADYARAFELAEAATDRVVAGWDTLQDRSEAVKSGMAAVTATFRAGVATAELFGVQTEALTASLLDSALVQDTLATATAGAEAALAAMGIEAEGAGSVLEGLTQVQTELAGALSATSTACADGMTRVQGMAEMMRFSGVAAEFASGWVGKLKLAFLGLFAVFTAINMAVELYQESEKIQQIVNRIVGMFRTGWSYIQEATATLVAWIETKFSFVVRGLYTQWAVFAQSIAQILSYVPGMEGVAARLNEIAENLRERLRDERSFEERRTEIAAAGAAERLQITQETQTKSEQISADFRARQRTAEVAGHAQANSDLRAAADESLRIAKELADAYAALRAGALENAHALLRDGLQREQAAIQQAYQRRLISERTYIEQMAELRTRATQAELDELARKDAELVRQRDALIAQQRSAVRSGDKNEALRIDAQIVAIEKQRDALLRQEIQHRRTLGDIDRDRLATITDLGHEEREAGEASQARVDDYVASLEEAARQRQFEVSLTGKTREEQELARAVHAAEVELQRIMNELARTELAIRTELARGEAARPQMLEDLYRRQGELDAQASAARDNIWRVETDTRDRINAESSANLRDGLTNAITDAIMNGKSIAGSFRSWLKQSFDSLVLRPTIQAIMGGGSGGNGGLIGSLVQGIGGLLGGGGGGGGGDWISTGIGMVSNLFGSSGMGSALGGGGMVGVMSSMLGGLGTMIGGAFGGGMVAGTSGIAAMFNGGGFAALGSAFSGAAAGGLASTLGAVVPVIGWIVAIAAALGAFNDKKGIKIDNSVKDGRNRKDIIDSALGQFDVSGDMSNETFQPLIERVNEIDQYMADNIFSEEALQRVKDNIQNISSDATDWWGFRNERTAKEAIEASSKHFLQQRYSVAFEEIDSQVATMIRTFSGSADELLAFIGTALQAVDALAQIKEEMPGLELSLAAVLKGSEEQLTTLLTLGQTFSATNADYAQAARDAYAESQRTLAQMLTDQGTKVRELAGSLDGSLASAKALAEAEAQRLQMVAALIIQIAQVADEVKAMFGNSAEEYRLATLSDDEKYMYFDAKAQAAWEELQAATDPARIRELAAEYDRYMKAGWNLLSPEQRERYGNDFADRADSANELAQQRLAQAEADALAEARTLSDEIKVSIEAAMQTVADKMQAAADKFVAAAGTPVVVTGTAVVHVETERDTYTADVGLHGIGA